jgi:hypothetical protein
MHFVGWIVAIAVVGIAAWWYYDERKYPMCPLCRGNAGCERKHLFDKEAWCPKHGAFLPKSGKSTPTIEEQRIWFEKCGCSNPQAHGHFYDFEFGQCPWPTMSNEAAEDTLKFLAEKRNLASGEMAAIRAEVRAAGLQENMDGDERELVTSLRFLRQLKQVVESRHIRIVFSG